MNKSKVCKDCETLKPITEYYFYKYLGRHANHCKPCGRLRARISYRKHAERQARTKRIYNQTERGKAAAKKRVYKAIETHPEKHKARYMFRYAVQAGKIQRQPCEICGLEKSEAHHYLGYEPEHWYDVQWLCRQHHFDAHGFSIRTKELV